MTLTAEGESGSDKLKQHSKYLGQRSFYSKVIVGTDRQTDTHPHNLLIALPGPQ